MWKWLRRLRLILAPDGLEDVLALGQVGESYVGCSVCGAAVHQLAHGIEGEYLVVSGLVKVNRIDTVV